MVWLGLTAGERALKRAALHDAQELRSRYGPDAERLCEAGLESAGSAEKRRLLKTIRRALDRLPS
jgi:hypothetical protein